MDIVVENWIQLRFNNLATKFQFASCWQFVRSHCQSIAAGWVCLGKRTVALLQLPKSSDAARAGVLAFAGEKSSAASFECCVGSNCLAYDL